MGLECIYVMLDTLQHVKYMCVIYIYTQRERERESKVRNFTVILYNTMTFSWPLYADSNKGILNNIECYI